MNHIFYASILDDGHVSSFDEGEMRTVLQRRFGVEGKKGDLGIYIPHKIQRQFAQERSSDAERHKGGSARDMIPKALKSKIGMGDGKEMDKQSSNAAHDSLYILKDELVSNEEIECKIFSKLSRLPEKQFIVKSAPHVF